MAAVSSVMCEKCVHLNLYSNLNKKAPCFVQGALYYMLADTYYKTILPPADIVHIV